MWLHKCAHTLPEDKTGPTGVACSTVTAGMWHRFWLCGLQCSTAPDSRGEHVMLRSRLLPVLFGSRPQLPSEYLIGYRSTDVFAAHDAFKGHSPTFPATQTSFMTGRILLFRPVSSRVGCSDRNSVWAGRSLLGKWNM